jgi:hypothetical protein
LQLAFTQQPPQIGHIPFQIFEGLQTWLEDVSFLPTEPQVLANQQEGGTECGRLNGGTLSMKDQWGGKKVLEIAQLLPEFAALAGRWENHVLAAALCLAFEVVLAGDTRFVDGVTFFGHAVVRGVFFILFLRVLFAVLFPYIETCWQSTQLLLDAESSRVQRDEQKSVFMKKQQCREAEWEL